MRTFFLCLFAWATCMAQSDPFLPGTIWLTDGTRLEGEIAYGNWRKNPTEIKFREGESAGSELLTPSDCESFVVKGERYVVRSIKYNSNSLSPKKLKWEVEPVWKTQTVFLAQYIEGDINFYVYVDSTQRYHYYVETAETPITPLLYHKYYRYDKTKTQVIQTRNDYRRQLLQVMPEISSGMRQKILQLPYSLKPIRKAILGYIEENERVEPTYIREWERANHDVQIWGGLTYTRLNFASDFVPQLNDPRFSRSLDWTAAVRYTYVPARFGEKLGIIIDLAYRQTSHQGTYVRPPEPNYEQTQEIFVGGEFIRLGFLGKRSFPLKQIKPYVIAGVSMAYALELQNEAQLTTRIFETISEDTREAFAARGFDNSWHIGGGIDFEALPLSVECRLEAATGLSKQGSVISRFQYLYLIAGFRLF